jgi:hypothetical protein
MPFEEVPKNIDITKAPQIREYDGDEFIKGFYVWDGQEKRFEILDLKPFGYIEGIKDGDWKVLRNSGTNTYYEWDEGVYKSNGSIGVEVDGDGNIASNSYPHWVKKTSDDWKTRIGNLWRICGNWGALYNVPKPSAGTDETCVIYYISNENDDNDDKDDPIDTLRGAIWKWDEELVRWLPQNLGTALTYTKPTDNGYWDVKKWIDNGTANSNDIPDSGKWSPILQSDVTNAYVSAFINDINPGPYKYYYSLSWTSISPVNPLLKIVPSIKKKYQYGSPPSVPITSITRDYDNLSQNNFA